MGKVYDAIDSRLEDFISKQRVFFVATAPLGGDGHVNLSPKGLDSFRVLGARQVAYLDLTGSGIETIAHLRENGRIVVMFCSFSGPPKIVRLHGRGRVVLPGDPGFEGLRARFPAHAGVRSAIVIDVQRISDSCGYGVPTYEFACERSALAEWTGKKSGAQLDAYRRENNAQSIDGLRGLGSEPVRSSV
jgi:hypothetical protein